jgi:hypothetical protein
MALPTKSIEELRLEEIQALTNIINIKQNLSKEVHEKAVKRLSILLDYGINKEDPYLVNKMGMDKNGNYTSNSKLWA